MQVHIIKLDCPLYDKQTAAEIKIIKKPNQKWYAAFGKRKQKR